MERHKVISGKAVIFDAEDIEYLEQFNLCLSADKSGRYSIQICEGELKGKHLLRLLMNCPEHLIVDHIDGNSLNNSKTNLRIATGTQNQANRKLQINNSTGVKGVSWCKRSKKYKVYLRRQHLGYFYNLEDAKAVYEQAAALLHGEFAVHISRPEKINGAKE